MNSEEIRRKYLDFFMAREHLQLPSASLVPQNDPSVLFNTAGMQPLVPYLLGQPHPAGRRLVNYQKCLRTNDIEEVGDPSHLTFFEMLGNWSLGDYFKEESIGWSFQFLTDGNEGLGLAPDRLYVSVFAGDENAPADTESARLWEALGIPSERIFYLPAEENWWPAPKVNDDTTGPCGPDTEIFYDLTEAGLGRLSAEEFLQAGDRGELVEIWNNVFMEYQKQQGRVTGRLEQQNVDTGMGLERVTAVLQGVPNVFETDLFLPLIQTIRTETALVTKLAESEQIRGERIVADHVRAAVFILSDGVNPSNTEAGYVLRRLLRRAVQYADQLGLPAGRLAGSVAKAVIEKYQGVYPALIEQAERIRSAVDQEEEKFRRAMKAGLKEFEKIAEAEQPISGASAFKLFSSYGMPLEMTIELAQARGLMVETEEFAQAYGRHQRQSRQAGVGRFKGGLAGTGSQQEVNYHTTTHLLNAALRQVLGTSVAQKGSNINDQRLRFDFTFSRKLTEAELKQVEELVNDKIQADLPVQCEELKLAEAYNRGAIGVFGESYPETVKVYTIGDEREVFSREICGGPHVEWTGRLGRFKITKEEAVAGGVRRIRGVLKDQ